MELFNYTQLNNSGMPGGLKMTQTSLLAWFELRNVKLFNFQFKRTYSQTHKRAKGNIQNRC